MTSDYRTRPDRTSDARVDTPHGSPGKRTLVESLDAVPSGGPGKHSRTETLVPRASGDGAPVQQKLTGDGAAAAPSRGGGSGSVMPPETQQKMEQSFGADFSAVRIHQGQSEMPGALAFTKGTDINFAPGQYDPHGQAGQALLGHETHVVQQSQGRVNTTTQSKGVDINNDPALEHEADVHGAAAARGEQVSSGAAPAVSGGGAPAVQCFVPADATARAAVTTALDTLLGVGIDPGGVRAAATGHAASLAALQGAVNTIVTVAAVPLGERAPLLALLGNDLELTAALLTAATAASGAGTPAVRLNRVLTANPMVPRTLADLQPLLTTQHAIDDKILRGRIGGALGPNERPTGEQRTLIGGHSPEVLSDPENVIESDVTNPNTTHYVGFRKLIRSDGGASAIAVRDATPDDPVARCLGAGATAAGAVAAAVAPINNVPPSLAAKNPAGFAKATAAYNAKLTTFTNAQAASATAYGQVQAHGVTVRAQAGAAAATPTNAADVKPFIDSMTDLLASMNALVQATTIVNPAAGATALAAFTAIKDRFETQGPVLSTKKNSTLAPAGMSEDDVLGAGDQTAAVPATLIRDDASNNTPVDGGQIDTKHQLVINGVVWVAMKAGVTYHRGPPITLTGGRVISSYPTSLTAVPPDPVHPLKDADRFSTIP